MFDSGWFAALTALFAWWFSTGAILWIVRQADRKDMGKHVTIWFFPVAILGAIGAEISYDMPTVAGAYLGFISVLMLWGWIELAFLTGQITGPNLYPCPDDVPQTERFIRAWGTIAYHEICLVAVLIILITTSAGAANTMAMSTFAVLFFARISAKLNLYLGVPQINTEFIPRALSHLPSHFRIRSLNWLFPISVTSLSFAVSYWIALFWQAAPAHAAGYAILAALTALALLEHWLMVLALPDAKLWRWMLPEAPSTVTQKQRHRREEQHGF